jgi:hypothetical protein
LLHSRNIKGFLDSCNSDIECYIETDAGTPP